MHGVEFKWRLLVTQLEFGKVLKQLLRENKKLMRCTNLTFGRLGLQFCENVDLWAGPAISQSVSPAWGRIRNS